MATSVEAGPAGSDADPIRAVPLRHTGRWISAAIVITLLGLLIYGAATNSAYDWSTFNKYLFDKRVSQAALITIYLTLIAMVVAVAAGVVLSVMRRSPNPVLKAVAWLYLWFFRGTPVYVQLTFWGLITTIYKRIDLGVPHGPYFLHLNLQQVHGLFWFAALGLALNESAYMAEIVRAGILSVNEGQTEAATALGMTWYQATRRIVLPQAMRVIIPPTGNELISMLKTTSLVVAVPYSYDLYARTRDIGTPIFDPVPLLLVASAWYLAITTVLTIGQSFVERYFSRGASRRLDVRQRRVWRGGRSSTPMVTP